VPQSAIGSTQIGKTLMILGDGNKVEQRIVKLGETHRMNREIKPAREIGPDLKIAAREDRQAT
jgi:hypothetical protein